MYSCRINTSCIEKSKEDRILYAGHPCSKFCSNRANDQGKKKKVLDVGSNITGGFNCIIKVCNLSFQNFPLKAC